VSAGDDERPSDFRRAMKGVKPLDRDRLRPEPEPELRRRPAGVADASERVAFAIERFGERVEGRAPDADPRELARLVRGEPEPEARIDLHGLDAAGAERELRRALLNAHEAGARCVLVVHGRGRRSEGPAVLREAFPDWLAEPPLGPRVLAFATAAPRHGGGGASYVLLRPRPAGRPKR
jgi:DNA-nicking Smr family endonuclease